MDGLAEAKILVNLLQSTGNYNLPSFVVDPFPTFLCP